MLFNVHVMKIVFYPLLQRLDKQGVSFCTRTTYDDNAITNAIEIYESLRYHDNFEK